MDEDRVNEIIPRFISKTSRLALAEHSPLKGQLKNNNLYVYGAWTAETEKPPIPSSLVRCNLDFLGRALNTQPTYLFWPLHSRGIMGRVCAGFR
ncbi:hypothetical protein ERO13_D11G296720v2 [Gossypium hirsutum]|uniref:Uncharacterized protein n=3 Tax=Gossypium TaxID=3633 RepID=A0A5J5PI75_GOSBA|nr:hypothetical protein ES319_D11G323900v1 [Gossypium barbadense]KAG4122905.1 hypothetical protein ERO13_D11G296720v2 [Gossypium hirsutum]TYG47482.1 hypothetical protein ES288_D11G342300v1 [Gossypium darwinii]